MGQSGGEERVIMKHGLYADQNYIMGVAEVMDISLDSSDMIHLLSPICVKRRPSSVTTAFKVTYGFPCLTK